MNNLESEDNIESKYRTFAKRVVRGTSTTPPRDSAAGPRRQGTAGSVRAEGLIDTSMQIRILLPRPRTIDSRRATTGAAVVCKEGEDNLGLREK